MHFTYLNLPSLAWQKLKIHMVYINAMHQSFNDSQHLLATKSVGSKQHGLQQKLLLLIKHVFHSIAS